MRCRIAAGSCPGGSTAWAINDVPVYMFSPTSTWAGAPLLSSSATAKISPRAVSITGVPVMPTVGPMLPHGRAPDGTGVPTCDDHRIAPVLAASA